MGLPAVRITEVTKSFGANKALDRASFEVAQGTIHALIGRNGAGKSTMVNLLAGLSKPTSGEIEFLKDTNRVGTVFQHSMLVPTLTVAENMFLGNLPLRLGQIDWSTVRTKTRERLDDWGLGVSEDALVSSLTVAQRQIVEIIRELSRGASFIILDEPTARIQGAEITELHSKVLRAKEMGTTFIYISHHLSEVMELCDFATVLRDGKIIATRKVAETDVSEFVADMVGEELPRLESERIDVPAAVQPLIVIERVESADLLIENLKLMPGEMLGIAGIVGSGKELLGAILSGEQSCNGLVMSLEGKPIEFRNPREAIESGVGYLPPDRHHQGLVLSLPVGENVTMSVLHRLASYLGLINLKKIDVVASGLMSRVGVKAASTSQIVSELSGGNQQKAVLAKALSTNPKLLILVNPTTGVDIASKANIYNIITESRKQGTAVILVSDEVEEFRMCNRVFVMSGGQLTAEFQDNWRMDDLIAEIEGVKN
jgi:simple sugar transport system ATP-binding protein